MFVLFLLHNVIFDNSQVPLGATAPSAPITYATALAGAHDQYAVCLLKGH